MAKEGAQRGGLGAEALAEAQRRWLEGIGQAGSLAALEELRVAALGAKGEITGLLKSLRELPPESRREAGAALNDLKTAVAEAVAGAKVLLEEREGEAALLAERLTRPCPWRAWRPGACTRPTA